MSLRSPMSPHVPMNDNIPSRSVSFRRLRVSPNNFIWKTVVRRVARWNRSAVIMLRATNAARVSLAGPGVSKRRVIGRKYSKATMLYTSPQTVSAPRPSVSQPEILDHFMNVFSTE